MGLINSWLARFRGPAIIVYQMGNVGSTTIHTSLQKARIRSYHVHHLNREHMQTFRDGYRQEAQRHAERVLAVMAGKSSSVKYITVMRDPVAGAYSGSFFRPLGGKETAAGLANEALTEKIAVDFEKRVSERIEQRLNWFEVELRSVLGVNVLDYDFPAEVGYREIKQGEIEILALTIETDNAVLENAIGQFVAAGASGFTLVRANTSEDSPHGDTYRAFKQQVKVSSALLDRAYGAEIVRHFYSAAQIRQFRQKWERA